MNHLTTILLLAGVLSIVCEDSCTTVIVGRKASLDGSTMTTHNLDCLNCDFRISRVPAKDHPRGAKRPIFPFRGEYPRFVGDSRGHTYQVDNLEKNVYDWSVTKPIASIPEVAHTFAYIDGGYGIMNEHQVAMGESTCGAVLVNFPHFAGGDALLEMTELSRIALERCTSARCAIKTMGDLAVKYGYYSGTWTGSEAKAEAGEAMTVSDPLEAWVFHILPDGSNSSAVWAAQRVPDDHISVVANQFVIRAIDFQDDGSNFLYSSNIRKVAQDNGLWNGQSEDEFDFTAVYADLRGNHSNYVNRRVWRVMDLAAPSLSLPSHVPPLPPANVYPFSVQPDQLLSDADLRRFMRDHFEGTEFDLTQGMQSGPYGNPARYDAGASYTGDLSATEAPLGVFERAISLFRTTYSTVTISRQHMDDVFGFTWFAQHNPHGSPYLPVYVSSPTVPAPLSSGSRYRFNKQAMFWNSLVISNYMERAFLPMIGDVNQQLVETEAQIKQAQAKMESEVAHQLQQHRHDHSQARNTIADFAHHIGEHVRSKWQDFFPYLVAKYHDGYRIDDFHAETMLPTKLFYPKWWLEQVGYFSPVSGTQPMSATAPSSFYSSRTSSLKIQDDQVARDYVAAVPAQDVPGTHIKDSSTRYNVAMLLLILGVFGAGFGIGRCMTQWKREYRGYSHIN